MMDKSEILSNSQIIFITLFSTGAQSAAAEPTHHTSYGNKEGGRFMEARHGLDPTSRPLAPPHFCFLNCGCQNKSMPRLFR